MYGKELLKGTPWVLVEPMPFEGELQITPDGWQIAYTITGKSEQGYRKVDTLYIPSGQIRLVYRAWQENFAKFEGMSQVLPSGSVVTVPGGEAMTIRIGNEPQGVSFNGDTKAISTKSTLNRVLLSYEYAVRRAKAVVSAIKVIDSHRPELPET